MLIKSLTYLKDKGEEWRDVKVYGQEINAGTSAIARMNLYLHGIHDFSIVNDNTLESPAFIKNGRVQQFNVVLANPPYSIKNWNREMFAHDKWGRNFLGTPPQECADYAFIQHILASLDENDGRCAILLPLGLLSKVSELDMRSNLIKSDLLEAIIGLGPNLFYNSPMEAMIMVCNRNKPDGMKGKILFINAVNEVTRKNAESKLEPKHIKKISTAFFEKKDVEHFCKVVDNQTVLDNGSNMTISLYAMPKIDREEILPLTDSINKWDLASGQANNCLETLMNLL
jgi:type I restriction enzyme M protein